MRRAIRRRRAEIQLLLGHAGLHIAQRYVNSTSVGVVRPMRELWGRAARSRARSNDAPPATGPSTARSEAPVAVDVLFGKTGAGDQT